MADPFFERPILNSPYKYPGRHWELDSIGQPTSKIIEARRMAEFITPIPKPKKRKKSTNQTEMAFEEAADVSSATQKYDPNPIINEIRRLVNAWRRLSNPGDWKVTPETQRLLQYWRHHDFQSVRPFFCQVEAVETAIWLTEVLPNLSEKVSGPILDHLRGANEEANPGLMRLALKLATGAGKTTVMAMLIAWQTINKARRPSSSRFTKGFLIVTPGITIRDRLRVLHPNDPYSYYEDRELVPRDMLRELEQAKIVITNYHAFKLRERMELSAGGRALLQGRGEPLQTLETEGQMLQRVMPDLMGMKNILVLNDEAHHCYREKPPEPDEVKLKGDDRKEALYGHYVKTFELWEKEGISVPPCFIVVCNNTSTSKLVYDFISGFERTNADGSTRLEYGRLALFRNYDEQGGRIARPRTLLIDSEQLESGEALDTNFRDMASDEIDRFRREIITRTGDVKAADKIDDATLLREVMNTVGKKGRLGEAIRCVVSVSMLTEGWDTNTVTHVLGVRAFGTQLLCEQVIGRALRRQSYDLNEENLFNVEYADVLGIPFDFTAKPVVTTPTPPRETIHVKAVRPDRDELEIRFPRLQGYRVELPEEQLTADFNENSVLTLTPELVGPTITKNQGIIGEGVDLKIEHLENMRRSTVLFNVTKRLLYTKFRDPGDEPELYLFGKLKRITRQWMDGYLECKGSTYPAQLMYQELADVACEKITAGITRSLIGTRPVKAVFDPYNPTGSTSHVSFTTSKRDRWETAASRCHVNWVILDSDWEAEFCRVAEAHPKVKAYVKNHSLGLEVPYRMGSEPKKYIPDFIVQVDDGRTIAGEPDYLNLIVEIKGYRGEDAKEKASTMEVYWVPAVNNSEKYGRWQFVEFCDVYQIEADFAEKVEAEFNKMIDEVTGDSPAVKANP